MFQLSVGRLIRITLLGLMMMTSVFTTPPITFSQHKARNTYSRNLIEAAEGGHTQRVLKLIRAGVDLDSRDNAGQTALMLAVAFDHIEIVRALIKGRANVNAKDDDGRTALDRAEQKPQIAGLLRRAGAKEAEPVVMDLNEQLLLAAQKGQAGLVNSLLERGANANAADPKSGHSPLYYAASLEIAEMLIKAGANINARDNWGFTPLMGAKNEQIADALIKAGADVNAKNNYGATVLMTAVRTVEIVKKLIAQGADVNAKNDQGETVLRYAKKLNRAITGSNTGSKFAEVIRILREAGAKD